MVLAERKTAPNPQTNAGENKNIQKGFKREKNPAATLLCLHSSSRPPPDYCNPKKFRFDRKSTAHETGNHLLNSEYEYEYEYEYE